MHSLEQVLKTARRAALTLALLVTAALAASPAAQASGPRPLFQMPFACGQTWEASTYTDNPDTEGPDGHWPDEDSIDLADAGGRRQQHQRGRAGARLGRGHRSGRDHDHR